MNRLALGVVEGTARFRDLYTVTEFFDPHKNDANPPPYLIDRKIGTGAADAGFTPGI